MGTIVTLICPNCGASATNHKNCEYCSSLFVRFVDKNIEFNKKIEYTDNIEIFKGLTEELQKNIKLQRAGNYSQAVATDIFTNEMKAGSFLSTIIMQLAKYDGTPYFPDATDDGQTHLMISFVFTGTITDDIRLKKFKGLDFHELFTENLYKDEYGKWVHDYAIDFGGDAEGAAMLLSKMFRLVYDLPNDTELAMFTDSGEDLYNRRDKLYNTKSERVKQKEKQNKKHSWVSWIISAVMYVILLFLMKDCG